MDPQPSKRIIIIAGPNGAGKTTFASEYLPNEANCPTFINADLIAAGLNPFQPERAAFQAGRMMLEMIDACVGRGENFAFETTLSGRGYARMIPRWREQGYSIRLLFLQLPIPEAAIARVKQRVAMGGHNIQEDVIRRRFHLGWRNFEQVYRGLVDEWETWDTSTHSLRERESIESETVVSPSAESEDCAWRSTYGKTNPGVRAAMARATMRARRLAVALTGRVVAVKNNRVLYETEP